VQEASAKASADKLTPWMTKTESNIARVDQKVPDGLKPHVQIAADGTVQFAYSAGTDMDAGRGSFLKRGAGAYVRGGGPEGVVTIGDIQSKSVAIAPNAGTPVTIGANGTTFNDPSGATIINSALRGGTVSISDDGGFRAARAFIKEPGLGAAQVKSRDSLLSVGDDSVIVHSGGNIRLQPINRVDIDAPQGLCFNNKCITPEMVAHVVDNYNNSQIAQTAAEADVATTVATNAEKLALDADARLAAAQGTKLKVA
jgi:hypothetical protein